MNPIAMVDLKGQYEKIKPQIDSAIQQVIDSTQFIKGPDVAKFQDEMATYLGVKHVIACGNGTDALQIAMMALGLKPGDEVITTNFTFIATVEVIALLGLKPVLVDVYPDTFNIDVNAVEKAITAKTRAIVPVHLFGQSADMESLMNLSKKHNIYIIEDTAQANGTNHYFKDGSVKKAGTIGHIGCTSFFPSKNLGCYGDGGALFTNDDNLAEQIHSIINHGMKVRYYHDRIGVNSRLDTIQAAILRVKLAHLDEYNKARNAAAQFYTNELSALQGIELPKTATFTNHIYHQYTLKIKDGKRDALKKHLEENGIPSMVYYPVPLHLQKAFSEYAIAGQSFPVTEQLSKEVLSLPMHTELEKDQLQYICQSIKSFFR
jgi:dTDP-4-amino-4,6-dideoxygalactose transaminase